jgi:protein-S-isoprenylcysteine O-methyltransferase Ste14
MITPSVPDGELSHRIRISRRTGLILSLVAVLIVYPFMFVVVPWALTVSTPRFGWTEQNPATWILFGLIPVVAGCAGLVWVFGVMLAQFPKLPEVVELEAGERLLTATSRVLISHGPFAYSRNPMFLSGLIVWFGWAIFSGSGLVLIATAVLWTLWSAFKVPQEERGPEARFGEAYRNYRRRVPRWIGPIRR